MPYPHLDPVLLQIGPFSLHWYAIAYIAGLVLGWRYILRLIDTPRLWTGNKPPMTKLHVDDALLWAALGVILGGRIGYVLVYNAHDYFSDPLQIFAVWKGGMSFHGGALGVLLALLFFSRKHNIPALAMFDVASAAAPIGLFFGRLANYNNGELWGRVTDVPWGMLFPGQYVPRHPSQLYEAALEGLLLFFVLWLLIYRFSALKRPGTVFGVFVMGYGIGRTIVECFREPDAQIGFLWGGLTMGMLLSIPMVIVGAFIVWKAPQIGARMQTLWKAKTRKT
jgi:phosphatidylglycerol:prolipoprotein diacylglycerol transferase